VVLQKSMKEVKILDKFLGPDGLVGPDGYLFTALLTFYNLQLYRNWCRQMWTERHAVAQLVEALRDKPECRGFDSQWGQWNFSLT
jgi:hypothetical protein